MAHFSPSTYDARNHACCLCLVHVTTASVPEYLTVFLLFGASQFFERLVKSFLCYDPVVVGKRKSVVVVSLPEYA